MFYYVYKTTNVITNKYYIGQHINNSTSAFDGYYGSGKLLKLSLKKHGKENFKREIIDFANNPDELDEKEIYWIAGLSATDLSIGYNLSIGGTGGDRIKNHPNEKEIRKYMSKRQKGPLNINYGKTLSDDIKKKISNSLKGKKRSKEHCENLSKSVKGRLRGRNNPNAKEYKFISPSGKEFIILGRFVNFCKQNKLNQDTMKAIANNKRKCKYHKRWGVIKIEE